MMRSLFLLSCLAPVAALAQAETFHGWSKDGTYLAYQAPGNNDITELFFCPTDATVAPSWPAGLNELDRTDERGLSCVRFIDMNKAPYQWKSTLVLPPPASQNNGIAALPELVTDGESPGIVLEAQGKKQSCYVSGLREDSRVLKTWWHPSSRFLAALVDGRFHHCVITLKGNKPAGVIRAVAPVKAPAAPKGKKK